MDKLMTDCINIYEGRGYSEKHDFPDEYLLMVNPDNLERASGRKSSRTASGYGGDGSSSSRSRLNY